MHSLMTHLTQLMSCTLTTTNVIFILVVEAQSFKHKLYPQNNFLSSI